jgi:hypothetical protein
MEFMPQAKTSHVGLFYHVFTKGMCGVAASYSTLNLERNKTPHRVLKEDVEPLLNRLCFMLPYE